MTTVFASLCSFLTDQEAAIAASVIASGTYELIKGSIDLMGLKKKVSAFFKDESQSEIFIKDMCELKAKNPEKPYRDIEDLYEKITGKEFHKEFYEELKQWILINKDSIVNAPKMQFNNQGGFNIGIQNAGNNLFNIQGDFNANKDS